MPPSSRALADLCWRLYACSCWAYPKEARTGTDQALDARESRTAALLIYVRATSLDARVLCGNTPAHPEARTEARHDSARTRARGELCRFRSWCLGLQPKPE
jgi:hypothetical protein